MKALLLTILLLLHPLSAEASGLPAWANSVIAQQYARIALIEWAGVSHQPLEPSRLAVKPVVLAREGRNGERVVYVIYEAPSGSYVVTLTVDNSGLLNVFGRGATMESPALLAHRFCDPAFDPSTLLEEG